MTLHILTLSGFAVTGDFSAIGVSVAICIRDDTFSPCARDHRRPVHSLLTASLHLPIAGAPQAHRNIRSGRTWNSCFAV
ncbi:uncharacterized protein PHACADRAFT_260381 [Phanerochaete carnosa HHB-10118-sp]|uniref:Uncharacterized protein n=1 Tax=Phanerochaete carnosa (strain HHB-10118-sp) TaxID=650164 RepID=K5WTU7_PHACS|nr:uncharacterized protein PHACADRAFT_260381 [Phanerochaete carnosa HHB-10118-sp]EKM53837.1 hypothetical protein PHACADRAFT_260381 [Phanerochaete carnosa HHB-10118-sp]